MKESRRSSESKHSCCHWYTNRYKTFLFIFPLSLFVILAALILTAWGIYQIVTAILAGGLPSGVVCQVLLGSYKILIALGGFLAALRSSINAARLLLVGYNVLLIGLAAEFIAQWAIWIMQLGGFGIGHDDRWYPSTSEIFFMVLSTIGFILFIILSVTYIGSLLHSFKAVLEAGGSGWERKAFFELNESLAAKSPPWIFCAPPDIPASKYLVQTSNDRFHQHQQHQHPQNHKSSSHTKHHGIPPKDDGLRSLSTIATFTMNHPPHPSHKQHKPSYQHHHNPQQHFLKPSKSIANLANRPPPILAPPDIHRESLRSLNYPMPPHPS